MGHKDGKPEFKEFLVDLNADCKCGCMDGDRFHEIYHFPNGYGASVVNNPKLIGFNSEGFRILPIKFSGPEDFVIAQIPQFDQSEFECKSWEDAVKTLNKLKNIDV
jgi:hypothetical protein